MSSTVTSIKKREETGEEHPDALRGALAGAIAAEREANAAVVSANENLKRGHAFVATAQAELDRAKALVEKAKERDSRASAAAVRNRAGASPDASSTRSARGAAQEREDNLEVALGTIERLEKDVAESEAALQWAVVDRMAAANAALAPICRALIARAREAAGRFEMARSLLLSLLNDPSRGAPEFSDALAGMRARAKITAPLAGLRGDAEAATGRSSSDEDRAAVEAAVTAMQSFVAQLAVDASAAPPALP
jgi:hypothetical protein